MAQLATPATPGVARWARLLSAQQVSVPVPGGMDGEPWRETEGTFNKLRGANESVCPQYMKKGGRSSMVTRRSITAAPTATVNSRPSVQIHLSTRIMERADGMASVASRDHWAAILRDKLTTNRARS